MPIEIVDVDDGAGALITMTGIIAEAELAEAYEPHLNQDREKFRRYRFSLTDLRGVTELKLSTHAVQDHARRCARAAERNPDAVVAVVAEQDLEFGLARMWQMLAEGTGWQIRVFRSDERARNWIRERVREEWNITDLTFDC